MYTLSKPDIHVYIEKVNLAETATPVGAGQLNVAFGLDGNLALDPAIASFEAFSISQSSGQTLSRPLRVVKCQASDWSVDAAFATAPFVSAIESLSCLHQDDLAQIELQGDNLAEV